MNRLFASAITLLVVCSPAAGHDYKRGDLTIGHPWARPTPAGAANGAAYITLTNAGKSADTLVSVQTPVADKAEVHEHIHDGDVMRMRPVTGGVPIAAGVTIAFKPGGYHIMLLGVKEPLAEGKSVPMTLTFEKAGTVDVELKIEKTRSETPEGHAMHMP